MSVFNKFASLIRRALVSNVSKDDGVFQIAQTKYNGKVADCDMVYPYGSGGNAPVGSLCLMFNVSAEEENKAAIPYSPNIRIKNLKEGEYYIANLLTGSYVILKENGDIDVDSKGNVNIKSAINVNIQSDANVSINGSGSVDITSDTASVTATSQIDVTSPIININGTTTVNGSVTATGAMGAASGSFGVGGLGMARIGDQVQVSTITGLGTIITGSTNNFAD